MELKCPYCSVEGIADDALAGGYVQCVECGKRFVARFVAKLKRHDAKSLDTTYQVATTSETTGVDISLDSQPVHSLHEESTHGLMESISNDTFSDPAVMSEVAVAEENVGSILAATAVEEEPITEEIVERSIVEEEAAEEFLEERQPIEEPVQKSKNIEICCAECSTEGYVPRAFAGKRIRCQNCGYRFIVEEGGTQVGEIEKIAAVSAEEAVQNADEMHYEVSAEGGDSNIDLTEFTQQGVEAEPQILEKKGKKGGLFARILLALVLMALIAVGAFFIYIQ